MLAVGASFILTWSFLFLIVCMYFGSNLNSSTCDVRTHLLLLCCTACCLTVVNPATRTSTCSLRDFALLSPCAPDSNATHPQSRTRAARSPGAPHPLPHPLLFREADAATTHRSALAAAPAGAAPAPVVAPSSPPVGTPFVLPEQGSTTILYIFQERAREIVLVQTIR